MSSENEQAKKIASILQGTVETFSTMVIADGQKQLDFQNKLNDFLSNKKISFDKIVDRICDAEHKLVLVTKELKCSNQRHQVLLDQQERQINRLELLGDAASTKSVVPQISPASVLKKMGIYASDKPVTLPLEQLADLINTVVAVH
jgi:hypothetical protein